MIFRKILLLINSLALVLILILCTTPFWPQSLYALATALLFLPLWLMNIPLTLMVVLTFWGHPRLTFLPLVSLILLLLFPLNFHLSAPQKHKTASVKIITANMGGGADFNLFAEWALSQNPDFIFLQEAYMSNKQDLKKRFNTGNWSLEQHNHLAVLSKHKVSSSEVKTRRIFNDWGAIAVHLLIQHPLGELNVFNIHLESPRDGLEALLHQRFKGIPELQRITKRQVAESRLIAEWAGQYDTDILAGDFNLPANHPVFHHFWSEYSDAFASAGWGLGHTKHTRWYGMAIDHILASRDWNIGETKVGPDCGGDHRPLITSLSKL